ncbi:MAG: hypothetical protein ACTH3S_09115, partial [Marinobacter sp.]
SRPTGKLKRRWPKSLDHYITVANLEKTGWAFPDRLKGSESSKGYVVSAKNTKLWLRAYASSSIEDEDNTEYEFSDDIELEIPALERRFL